MLKYLFFLLLLSVCVAEELPKTFYKLSTPLYNSAPIIKKLSDMKSIEDTSIYIKEVSQVKKCAYEVDKKRDRKNTKEYLYKLRKLQKNYERILYKIHKNISKSVDENDYDSFVKLTEYPFDGLLKSTALYYKSLEFYKKYKKEKRIDFFEKKMKYERIEEQTTQEFFNLATTSLYNSNQTKKNPKNKVQIEAKDTGKYIAVFIENLNPYTITLKIKDSIQNFDYDKNIKKEFTLKSGQRKEYLRLFKQKEKFNFSYSFSYTWIIGSVDAIHDDSYVYRLPFAKGTSHRVTQGYNGKYTHKGHSQYAIDFGMSIGTKIFAVREGVVVKLKENSNKGGVGREFSKYGNYITIEHSDATFATYYHLNKNGVLPRLTQKIKRGEFIAYSGNTGYSSGPHLHLSIFKASSASRTKTIPIKLLGKNGIIKVPIQGKIYTAK